MIIKARGIILQESPVGEKDKRLVILTKEFGKLTGFAKGCRSPKKQMSASTQVMTYGDFLINKTSKSCNIREIDIIESFFEIRYDIEKLAYAMNILEIGAYFSMEEEENPILLRLILKALMVIKKDMMGLDMILSIYKLKVLAINGIAPNIDYCINCGQTITNKGFFSFRRDGIICPSCESTQKKNMYVNEVILYTMRYIITNHVSNVFKFTLKMDVEKVFNDIIKSYFEWHIEYPLKTSKFLEKLQEDLMN